MLEDAGLIEQREGRLELTPRGIRAIGSKALADLYRKLLKDRAGRHERRARGRRATSTRTTTSPTSSATRSTSTCRRR